MQEHLSEEAKRAIREGDSERAEYIERVTEGFEAEGATFDFVPASKRMKELLGVTNSIVINKLPENVFRSHNIGEFTDYLIREARRQGALVYYTAENTDYILAQFPDRPEEAFSVRAFRGSINSMYKSQFRNNS